MSGGRADRLERAIFKELTVIVRALKDPELSGFWTLKEVRMSKDLKTAIVFYSVLGSREEREATGRALERAKGFLRKILAERLHIRHIPQISFSYDNSAERADRIERILTKLEDEREDQPGEDKPGGEPS